MKEYINEIYQALAITNVTEEEMKRCIKHTINHVLLYCNRTDIPKALEYIIVQMVEDTFSTNASTTETNVTNEISSIKRGDTTITYNNATSTTEANISFLSNYEQQLITFKKMRLPS